MWGVRMKKSMVALLSSVVRDEMKMIQAGGPTAKIRSRGRHNWMQRLGGTRIIIVILFISVVL